MIIPGSRPYQVEANDSIKKAVADRKRLMLVAMATGTGKIFTLVNQVYRLMKSGVGQRILFLVDRRALAAQAVRAFASFEPEPGLKFDKIYEVYSQRFQGGDFDEAEYLIRRRCRIPTSSIPSKVMLLSTSARSSG
jgi:type I restriction enzyme R subunit